MEKGVYHNTSRQSKRCMTNRFLKVWKRNKKVLDKLHGTRYYIEADSRRGKQKPHRNTAGCSLKTKQYKQIMQSHD